MTLIIENNNAKPQFILYIKKKVLSYIATILNPRKLVIYDEYFNSDEYKQLSRGIHISSRQVIWLSLMNLSHKRYQDVTHIFINPHLCYPGTEIKLVDLCKLINYGTMTLEPYPIFTFTFNHFEKNIKKYFGRYVRGLGR